MAAYQYSSQLDLMGLVGLFAFMTKRAPQQCCRIKGEGRRAPLVRFKVTQDIPLPVL